MEREKTKRNRTLDRTMTQAHWLAVCARVLASSSSSRYVNIEKENASERERERVVARIDRRNNDRYGRGAKIDERMPKKYGQVY